MLTVSPSFLVLFEPDAKHDHVREFGVETYQVCLEIRDMLECGAVAMPLQSVNQSRGSDSDNVAFFLQLHVRTLDGKRFCEQEDTAHAWCVVFWMSTRDELHEVAQRLLSLMEIVRRKAPGRQNSLTTIPFPCLDCISEIEAATQLRLKQQMKTSQLRNFLSTEAQKAPSEEGSPVASKSGLRSLAIRKPSFEEVSSFAVKIASKAFERRESEPEAVRRQETVAPAEEEVSAQEEPVEEAVAESPPAELAAPAEADMENLGIVLDPGKVGKTLLTGQLAIALWEYLPATIRIGVGVKWVLRYTPKAHGISLQTLFFNCQGYDETLLLVQDAEEHVFGGFAAQPWELSTRFYGSGEAFVFSFGRLAAGAAASEPSIFTWTSANSYFMYSDEMGIAMGGGNGRHAFYLSSGLLRGYSGPTETFGNPTLAASEEFVVKDFEIWGFEED